MRVVLSVLISLLLLGCGERPDAALLRPQAVAEPAGARVVRLHSVTTRQPVPGAPWAYGVGRASAPQYAAFDVSIPPGHVPGQIEWPKSAATANPARDFVTRGQARMDRAAFLSQLGRGDVGVYVHGFNTSFQEALFRLAQLTADAHLEGSPVLFSWPSQAYVAAYLADRDGSDYSRNALVALMADLSETRRGSDRVLVLGHSMGARLTMEALRQLKLTGRQDVLDRLEVILAAPDIDIDLFRDQIGVIGKMRHPITVLVSSDDRALEVSARLAARRTRLGQVDVRNPSVQRLALQSGIRIVDITKLPSNDSAHSRYVGLMSGQGGTAPRNPLEGLRQAGAFVFDQVGDTFHGIGTVLGD